MAQSLESQNRVVRKLVTTGCRNRNTGTRIAVDLFDEVIARDPGYGVAGFTRRHRSLKYEGSKQNVPVRRPEHLQSGMEGLWRKRMVGVALVPDLAGRDRASSCTSAWSQQSRETWC